MKDRKIMLEAAVAWLVQARWHQNKYDEGYGDNYKAKRDECLAEYVALINPLFRESGSAEALPS